MRLSLHPIYFLAIMNKSLTNHCVLLRCAVGVGSGFGSVDVTLCSTKWCDYAGITAMMSLCLSLAGQIKSTVQLFPLKLIKTKTAAPRKESIFHQTLAFKTVSKAFRWSITLC